MPVESQRRGRPVGADGDEVEWVNNYGRWGCDSDSDDDDECASITYSILSDYDDASSMFTTPPDSPPPLTPNTSPVRQVFYMRTSSECTSSECPPSPSTPTSPTQWLRRALSKPLLRTTKKADTPPPSPVSAPDGLSLQAYPLVLGEKTSSDTCAHDLVAEDPFAKEPLSLGLQDMNAQAMESGEVLPRGEVSCWSASSESLVMHRRVGWSSLKQLFKRTR